MSYIIVYIYIYIYVYVLYYTLIYYNEHYTIAPYVGLRESHCPLVIGSLIKEATTTFFQGYLDDVSKLYVIYSHLL